MTYVRQPVPEWADMIAERDAEIKRLRAALEEAAKICEEIGDEWYYENGQYHSKAAAVIRALKEKKDD